MSTFAALDVSQEPTAVCVVDETGRILVERKVPSFLARHAPGLERAGNRPDPWRFGFGTSCMTEACPSFALMLVT